MAKPIVVTIGAINSVIVAVNITVTVVTLVDATIRRTITTAKTGLIEC